MTAYQILASQCCQHLTFHKELQSWEVIHKGMPRPQLAGGVHIYCCEDYVTFLEKHNQEKFSLEIELLCKNW